MSESGTWGDGACTGAFPTYMAVSTMAASSSSPLPLTGLCPTPGFISYGFLPLALVPVLPCLCCACAFVALGLVLVFALTQQAALGVPPLTRGTSTNHVKKWEYYCSFSRLCVLCSRFSLFWVYQPCMGFYVSFFLISLCLECMLTKDY